jgi:hypothetical protein
MKVDFEQAFNETKSQSILADLACLMGCNVNIETSYEKIPNLSYTLSLAKTNKLTNRYILV